MEVIFSRILFKANPICAFFYIIGRFPLMRDRRKTSGKITINRWRICRFCSFLFNQIGVQPEIPWCSKCFCNCFQVKKLSFCFMLTIEICNSFCANFLQLQRHSTVKCPYWCKHVMQPLVSDRSVALSAWSIYDVSWANWLIDRWKTWMFFHLTSLSQMTSCQYFITL